MATAPSVGEGQDREGAIARAELCDAAPALSYLVATVIDSRPLSGMISVNVLDMGPYGTSATHEPRSVLASASR